MKAFRRGRAFARLGPWVAGVAAAAAALPSFAIPPISDDWLLLAMAEEGFVPRLPFGYVRPITLAAFRAAHSIAGPAVWPLHLATVLLAAACAALSAVVFRSWTGKPVLSALAATMFAVHPLHVEVYAWPSALGDVCATVGALSMVWCFERWRRTGSPAAWLGASAAALLALFSKEVAVAAPALLLAPRRGSSRVRDRRWIVGAVLPATAAAAAFLFWVRPILLLREDVAIRWPAAGRAARNALYYLAAAVLPLPGECLEAAPALFACACVGLLGAAWIARRRRSARHHAIAAGAAALAALLAAPALLSFQSRHFFLASLAASLSVAAVLRSLRPLPARAAFVSGAVLWGAFALVHWEGWFEAATASRRLVADLERFASDPSVREIVVANVPHRVRGMPVFGDFEAALRVRPGRATEVRCAARVDLRTWGEDAIDTSFAPHFDEERGIVVVVLRPGSGLHRRIVAVGPPRGGTVRDPEVGVLRDLGDGRFRLEIPARPETGRLILVWSGGELVPAGPHPRAR